MKLVTEIFNLMQVGVCLFHEKDDGALEARPYNFIIFPDETSKNRIRMDVTPHLVPISSVFLDVMMHHV
ncbi:hypothetical protein T484DRAFT_1833467 [Baffinella frigidus]|nr:hypothetical protein T484DRAFT_1833467 [Cryptophyta sp. CCMP2293]